MAHCSYRPGLWAPCPHLRTHPPPGQVEDGEEGLVPRGCPWSQLKQTGPTVNPNWCEASPLWNTARSRRGSRESSSVVNWKMVSVMEDSLSS